MMQKEGAIKKNDKTKNDLTRYTPSADKKKDIKKKYICDSWGERGKKSADIQIRRYLKRANRSVNF